ncbi:SAM-dependent methyltransferase [Nocardia panacis]|uniref:S-adenosyl-L-methionine-dependent methyltransferase n=1 Tax=Nocardia panacis TaxID=2340916 RepID=A0A3A4KDK2_9NOCA|nr:SAM-dependent methyltransferase [Nocardia panacis]RJO70955.1 SAM-dependent methyltransferase [Nocardia panacis]
MRTDSDSWDINTSVGSTALFVAATRALVGREPDPLAVDPLAEVFLRASGGEWVELLEGRAEGHALLTPEFGPSFLAHVGARTRYFDEYLAAAVRDGVRQVVILAAGLDARAYRMAELEEATVYELDRAEVLEFKRETLAAAGHKPRGERREVPVDLRGDWPTALRDKGFDPAEATAWLIEGLLIYLAPRAQDDLFAAVVANSAPGSRVAIEAMEPLPADLYESMRNAGHELAEEQRQWVDLIYNDPRADAAQWFTEHGWSARRTGLGEYLRELGRELPVAPVTSHVFLVTAQQPR